MFHLVGILFPHINDDARSKSHQIYFVCVFVAKCIYITEVMLGGKTVSRGVLVDVAVP